jgi:hypothetical protein
LIDFLRLDLRAFFPWGRRFLLLRTAMGHGTGAYLASPIGDLVSVRSSAHLAKAVKAGGPALGAGHNFSLSK